MASAFFQSSNDCSVSMILRGVGMEQYTHLLTKKGLTFDTFVNLTKEDMGVLGIKDETDKLILVDALRSFRNLYSEIDHIEPLNTEAVMSNTVHQLRTISLVLSAIRKKIERQQLTNTLVDSSTPTSEAIEVFLDQALYHIQLIRKDIISLMPQNVPQTTRRKYMIRRAIVLGFCSLVVIAGIRFLRN